MSSACECGARGAQRYRAVPGRAFVYPARGLNSGDGSRQIRNPAKCTNARPGTDISADDLFDDRWPPVVPREVVGRDRYKGGRSSKDDG